MEKRSPGADIKRWRRGVVACEIQQQWPSQIPIDGLNILPADIGCKPA
jgi:hypothetical protein